MSDLELKEKALFLSAGVIGGFAIHRILAMAQQKLGGGERLVDLHGRDFGMIAGMVSFIFPESKWKYIIGGIGGGMALDDVVYHVLKQQPFPPLKLGEQKEKADRYYHNIHIDPGLPLEEKEKIICPLFPQIINEMRTKPEQRKAVWRFKMLSGMNPHRLSMKDVMAAQKWYRRYGIYNANEGRWYAHDRWRTMAKIIEQYDKGGKTSYDCDCASLNFNQVVDSYGLPTYFVLVSQKTSPNPKTLTSPFEMAPVVQHPLHHVLPAVMYNGELHLVEMIRPMPIVPIKYAGTQFENLKRLIIVYPDGYYEEYHGWKNHTKLNKKYGEHWDNKFPMVNKYLGGDITVT